MPCDSGWHPVVSDSGEDGRGKCVFNGPRVHTRTEYERGVRENFMVFDAHGQSMRLRAKLVSPKLPDTIEFSLTYQRR